MVGFQKLKEALLEIYLDYAHLFDRRWVVDDALELDINLPPFLGSWMRIAFETARKILKCSSL